MSERPQPIFDAAQDVRRADVPPDVVAYADNLMLQLDAIVARYGFRDFRDAMGVPDGERHARLEAVMDLADLDRYRELILGYREAITKKRIPAADRHWRDAELARSFAYDREKARELGFAERFVEAHPGAQELMDALYARDQRFVTSFDADGEAVLDQDALKAFWLAGCSDLPDVPGESMGFFHWVAEHRLSDSFGRDNKATVTMPSGSHRLRFGSAEFLLAMDWAEFEPRVAAEKAAAVSARSAAVMRRLFDVESVTGLSREEVNVGLYSDQKARIPTARALAVIRDLIGAAENPARYELRLMRLDEYARLAGTQNYGKKNLNVQLDDSVAHPDGTNHGLIAGFRDGGGAASVAAIPRYIHAEDTAVRLVLSRKV